MDESGHLIIERLDGAGSDAVFEVGGEAFHVSEQSPSKATDRLRRESQGRCAPIAKTGLRLFRRVRGLVDAAKVLLE